MRALFLSDVHADGPDDPAQVALVGWLAQVEADALYLLGDVFHTWWGYPDATFPRYRAVCDALLDVRRRGVPITLVPGNHDFEAGPFFTEALGARILPHHPVSLDGRRLYLAHGDEADQTFGYRLTRLALRGAAFRAGMSALGPERGLALLQRLAGASRRAPAPQAWLIAAQRDWAQARVSEGAELVVLGHSHAPGVTPLQGGALYNLGDWSQGPRWLRLEDGVPTLEHQASTRASISGSSSSRPAPSTAQRLGSSASTTGSSV